MSLLHAVAAVIILISCSEVISLKILIYSPAIGHSHLQFVGKLADILVIAGHDVVISLYTIIMKLVHGYKKKHKEEKINSKVKKNSINLEGGEEGPQLTESANAPSFRI